MVKIYYCNWDKNKNNRLVLFGEQVEFNNDNYELVKTEDISLPNITDDELEKLISEVDSDNTESVNNLFDELLNSLYSKYNDNPSTNIRSMCVGDIIQLVSSNYTINYLVCMIGFKII